MVRRNPTGDRSVALFLLGALLLLPPLLQIFNRADRFLGIPLLYLYIFIAWAALIALAAAIAARIAPDQPGAEVVDSSASGDPDDAERVRDA